MAAARESVASTSAAAGAPGALQSSAPLVLEDVTTATRLLEKRRQVFEVQESLESGQAEFGRKEDVFKRREESLKGKDAELQDSLVRFSKFLQENDQKRARADKRAADEAKVRAGKEREAEQLSAALAAVRVQTARAGEVAEKTRQYQRFLERVLEHAAQHTSAFTEVNDLLLRHAALHATNSDLKRHMRKCADEADATRAELQALRKNEVNEVLLLNNRIAQLKKELEDRERDVMVLEGSVDSGLQVASQKTLEHGVVCSATENLYALSLERSRIARPGYSAAQTLEQLGVVRDFMSDLSAIVAAKARSGGGSAGGAGPAAS